MSEINVEEHYKPVDAGYLEDTEYNPTSERIVEILCKKTQNNNKEFFRVLVSYYLGLVAGSMRTYVKTADRGDIPVNVYALNLAGSGFGKGFSSNIIIKELLAGFKKRVFEDVIPLLADQNLAKLAATRAYVKGTDIDEERLAVDKEYENQGPIPFSFDSGSPEAFKQIRHKLLMNGVWSMNFTCDEIGSKILNNTDLLTTCLEAYDKGEVGQKITKNGDSNKRIEEIEGEVPTNMLLFGTHDKVLKGDKVEDELISFFEIGFGRRLLFGFSPKSDKNFDLSADEIYDMLTTNELSREIKEISDLFEGLGGVANYNTHILVPRPIGIRLIEYKLYCEQIAHNMGSNEEIQKAEISHRYFKAIKLAGAYAFIEGNSEITEQNLKNAIKIVEDSGRSLVKILNREKNWVRLAKYIVEQGRVNSVDLVENLPWFKGSAVHKNEIVNLAIAWSYNNNIVMKREVANNVEFFSADKLQETDLTKMKVSYSTDIAKGYLNEELNFDDELMELVTTPGYHWVNHQFTNGHRAGVNIVPGFNCVVLDIDKGTTIEEFKVLMKEYKYILHTTKRHGKDGERFRVIIPMNFELKLTKDDFKLFMNNIFNWLPIEVDSATSQRARKWETFSDADSIAFAHDGELLDVLPFIPNSQKNQEYKNKVEALGSLNNLERWFLLNTDAGNRNNNVLRYALTLVDAGKALDEVRRHVIELNDKLPGGGLPAAEIDHTIMVTAAKRFSEKHSN